MPWRRTEQGDLHKARWFSYPLLGISGNSRLCQLLQSPPITILQLQPGARRPHGAHFGIFHGGCGKEPPVVLPTSTYGVSFFVAPPHLCRHRHRGRSIRLLWSTDGGIWVEPQVVLGQDPIRRHPLSSTLRPSRTCLDSIARRSDRGISSVCSVCRCIFV